MRPMGTRDMPAGADHLERMLGGLFPDEPSNLEHRELLEPEILRARAAYVAQRAGDRGPAAAVRATLGTLWQRRSAAVAAVVLLAVGVTLIMLNGWGTLDGARPAWALDQSIAALQSVRSVHMSGKQAGDVPCECWIKPKAGGDELDSLRFESKNLIAVVRNDTVRAYLPASNTAEVLEGQYVQALRAWHLALELRPWVGDTLLAQLKERAANWYESYGRDQRGRDCVFVQCSYPPLGISFDFAFDAQTKLVVEVRQWQNLTRDGDPAFDIRSITYNEDVPDERFVLEVPEGARVLDAANTSERRALLDRAEALHSQKLYAEAIDVYQQVYEQYPEWNNAEHALMMIGTCYDNLGRRDRALEYLERAVREYPDLRGWSEVTYYCLGEQYLHHGEREKALQAFEKCIELCRGVRDPNGWPWKQAAEAIERMEAPQR